MTVTDIFINGKKVNLEGLTKAKLEHMLQLGEDDLRRYKSACKNYPPDKMEKYGKPFIERTQSYITRIKNAIQSAT